MSDEFEVVVKYGKYGSPSHTIFCNFREAFERFSVPYSHTFNRDEVRSKVQRQGFYLFLDDNLLEEVSIQAKT